MSHNSQDQVISLLRSIEAKLVKLSVSSGSGAAAFSSKNFDSQPPCTSESSRGRSRVLAFVVEVVGVPAMTVVKLVILCKLPYAHFPWQPGKLISADVTEPTTAAAKSAINETEIAKILSQRTHLITLLALYFLVMTLMDALRVHYPVH